MSRDHLTDRDVSFVRGRIILLMKAIGVQRKLLCVQAAGILVGMIQLCYAASFYCAYAPDYQAFVIGTVLTSVWAVCLVAILVAAMRLSYLRLLRQKRQLYLLQRIWVEPDAETVRNYTKEFNDNE